MVEDGWWRRVVEAEQSKLAVGRRRCDDQVVEVDATAPEEDGNGW